MPTYKAKLRQKNLQCLSGPPLGGIDVRRHNAATLFTRKLVVFFVLFWLDQFLVGKGGVYSIITSICTS